MFFTANINVLGKVTGKYDIRDDGTYLILKNKTLKIDIGHARLHFSDLFNGDKELSEFIPLLNLAPSVTIRDFDISLRVPARTTNMFVNENWREIMEELSPLIEETVGEFMQIFLKGFLNTFSLDDLMPK